MTRLGLVRIEIVLTMSRKSLSSANRWEHSLMSSIWEGDSTPISKKMSLLRSLLPDVRCYVRELTQL